MSLKGAGIVLLKFEPITRGDGVALTREAHQLTDERCPDCGSRLARDCKGTEFRRHLDLMPKRDRKTHQIIATVMAVRSTVVERPRVGAKAILAESSRPEPIFRRNCSTRIVGHSRGSGTFTPSRRRLRHRLRGHLPVPSYRRPLRARLLLRLGQ